MLLAAMGVFGTRTGWPDVIVAAIVGGLRLWGGWQTVSQARGEVRSRVLHRSPWRPNKATGRKQAGVARHTRAALIGGDPIFGNEDWCVVANVA